MNYSTIGSMAPQPPGAAAEHLGTRTAENTVEHDRTLLCRHPWVLLIGNPAWSLCTGSVRHTKCPRKDGNNVVPFDV